MRNLRVPMAGDPYMVYVGSGILERLPALLAARFQTRKAFLVSDAHLAAGLGRKTAGALKRAGWEVQTAALPRGEAAKSLKAVEKLYAAMLRARVERSTPLIALGGGALGDSAGFAAATYFRGIPLVHVPSTLLAQVDSSVGGKTAIDLPLGKNSVGAFHQPALVLSDVALLRSLPPRQLLSGLAEVVKMALVFDPGFGRWLELNWDALLQREPEALAHAVAVSVRWKAEVVAEDEFERTGRRELLNFGHTLGHALEAASGYRCLHGEAVAWGCRAAVALSEGRGWLTGKERGQAARLLENLGRAKVPGLRRASVLSGLKSDKKVQGKKNVFILLKGLGRPVRVSDVERQELEAAARRAGVPPWGGRQ